MLPRAALLIGLPSRYSKSQDEEHPPVERCESQLCISCWRTLGEILGPFEDILVLFYL